MCGESCGGGIDPPLQFASSQSDHGVGERRQRGIRFLQLRRESHLLAAQTSQFAVGRRCALPESLRAAQLSVEKVGQGLGAERRFQPETPGESSRLRIYAVDALL